MLTANINLFTMGVRKHPCILSAPPDGAVCSLGFDMGLGHVGAGRVQDSDHRETAICTQNDIFLFSVSPYCPSPAPPSLNI